MDILDPDLLLLGDVDVGGLHGLLHLLGHLCAQSPGPPGSSGGEQDQESVLEEQGRQCGL